MLNKYSLASGEIAGGYGASFFDDVMAENGETREGVIYSFSNTEANNKAVRGMMQDVVAGGSVASFFDAIQNRLDYNIRRTSNQCVLENIKDRSKHLKFARVPTGLETCAFCFMLASRGFVYWSRATAGEFDHYHSNCNCRIVPGFDDVDPDSQVEGYEPSKYYKQYEDCYKAVRESNGSFDYDLYLKDVAKGKYGTTPDEWQRWKDNRLMNEIRSRDVNWRWTGEPTTVGYTTKDVQRKVSRTEENTATSLSQHGRKCIFKQDYEKVLVNGIKQRKGLADMECGIELKAISESKSAWGAVKNHLKNANDKRDVKEVVFDLTNLKYLKEEAVIEQIKQQIDKFPNIKDVFALTKGEGELTNLYRVT